VGGVARSILRLAGIKDAWGFTKGHSRTTVNYAFAAFDALRQTGAMKMSEEQSKKLCIASGPTEIRAEDDTPEPIETEGEPKEEEKTSEAQGSEGEKAKEKSE
jgi:small subunit ribosomal protein S5